MRLDEALSGPILGYATPVVQGPVRRSTVQKARGGDLLRLPAPDVWWTPVTWPVVDERALEWVHTHPATFHEGLAEGGEE